jgi:hypothetical protein
VFRRNQYRRTDLALVKGKHGFDWGRGVTFDWKLKWLHDVDYRALHQPGATQDDYDGTILQARGGVAVQVADGVQLGGFLGADHWDEKNRRGTLELGYGDDVTLKWTGGLRSQIVYGGAKVAYHLEYLWKDQDREREPDQQWRVWRSKLTLDVAW